MRGAHPEGKRLHGQSGECLASLLAPQEGHAYSSPRYMSASLFAIRTKTTAATSRNGLMTAKGGEAPLRAQAASRSRLAPPTVSVMSMLPRVARE